MNTKLTTARVIAGAVLVMVTVIVTYALYRGHAVQLRLKLPGTALEIGTTK